MSSQKQPVKRRASEQARLFGVSSTRSRLLNLGKKEERRLMEDAAESSCSHFLLCLHESFHIAHYHNWVCFCSPLSITRIYCNKLNLVSAASLDLPEFVISGARLICCNLI